MRKTFSLSALALLVPIAACAIDTGDSSSQSSALKGIPTGDPEPTGTVTTPPPPPPPPSFESLMASYTPFDINADGTKEINSLAYGLPDNTPPSSAPKGMVVVFVDPRHLAERPDLQISGTLLKLYMMMWRSDLIGEGYDPRFVVADVYRGGRHQDGRTVMALRRFLKTVRASYPLRSVVFLGDFPEAAIARRLMVRGAFTGNLGGTEYTNEQVVDVSSELVSARTDLPLADLDGNWEALYAEQMTVTDVTIRPETGIPGSGIWPAPGGVYTSVHYQTRSRTYNDVFYVRDDDTTQWEAFGEMRVTVGSITDKNPELGPSDVATANPIARPELQVSRINPRHVAVQPFTKNSIGGFESALDIDGLPQPVPAYGGNDVVWRQSDDLERRILVDFLRRDRAFRQGSDGAFPFRYGAIRARNGADLPSASVLSSYLSGAATGWSGSNTFNDATLDSYTAWLRSPVALRGIVSHSDWRNSNIGAPVTALGLESAIGIPAFHWVREEGVIPMLKPTWMKDSQGALSVDANLEFHRTIFESTVMANAGQSFFVHDGCEVNSPNGVSTDPYSSDKYAPMHNGESVLFFLHGLGMIARAKVFNDHEPAGAMLAVKNAGNFGASLQGYSSTDANDASLKPGTGMTWVEHRERTLQRKRSYFWSILGDGTLRLRY